MLRLYRESASPSMAAFLSNLFAFFLSSITFDQASQSRNLFGLVSWLLCQLPPVLDDFAGDVKAVGKWPLENVAVLAVVLCVLVFFLYGLCVDPKKGRCVDCDVDCVQLSIHN